MGDYRSRVNEDYENVSVGEETQYNIAKCANYIKLGTVIVVKM